MSFLSLVGVEFKKIKRSKIFLILFVATVILWIPSILNADMNFNMQAEGISPENNFFIQGFMGMAWFAYPMSYPFFVITSEYGKLATNLTTSQVELFSWIPVAIAITIVCLCISCFRFGQAERR